MTNIHNGTCSFCGKGSTPLNPTTLVAIKREGPFPCICDNCTKEVFTYLFFRGGLDRISALELLTLSNVQASGLAQITGEEFMKRICTAIIENVQTNPR